MSIGSRDLSWRHKEGLLLPENKMMYADSSIGEGMDITIQVRDHEHHADDHDTDDHHADVKTWISPCS